MTIEAIPTNPEGANYRLVQVHVRFDQERISRLEEEELCQTGKWKEGN